MHYTGKSRIIAMVLVVAMIIAMVPTAAFAIKVNPTPSKTEIPIGAQDAEVSNITIEETGSAEFPVADTIVNVTLTDQGDNARVHFAAVPSVTGSNVHNVTMVSDTNLRFTINGTAGTDSFAISGIKYKVDTNAVKGDVKATVAVTGGSTLVVNNAKVVDGVYTALSGAKTALAATGANQSVQGLAITESAAAQWQSGKKLTLTADTTGVTFSQVPTAEVTAGDLTLGAGVLSGDSKSVSYDVTGSSTAASTVTISNVKYDVASTTAQGDLKIGISSDGTTKINPASLANAELTVSGTITVSAATNAVTTGNGKDAGNITISESQKASVATGTLTIALPAVGGKQPTFQSAPTGTATGGIMFTSGSTSAASVAGTLVAPAYTSVTFPVDTQSTSTGAITISGLKLNIPAGTSGNIVANVSGAGISGTKTVTIATVSVSAIATVEASSQTSIDKNKANQAAGDILIKEASAGSLAGNTWVFLQIFGQNTTDNAITWGGTPTVQVTSGNATIQTAVASENGFTMRFQLGASASTEASTIKISGIKLDTTSKAADGAVIIDVRTDTDNTVADSSRLGTGSPAFVGTKPAAFPDVPTTHWAVSYIENLVAKGIIAGYTDGTFKPSNTITRAEFAKIVAVAKGLSTASGSSFSDTSGHWAAGYIEAVKAAGIIGGYADGTFRPNNNITRAEIAKIVVVAGGYTTNTSGAGFSDIAGHWASDYILTAANQGIVGGYTDGTFKPNNSATRAEASKMVSVWVNK